MHFTSIAGLASLALAQITSGAALVERATNKPYIGRAHTAVKKLQTFYKTPSPVPWSPGWWNNAQCLTLLADLRAADDSDFIKRITDGQQGVFNVTWRDQARNSDGALDYTRWFDDRLWWVVAMVKTFDVTQNPQYLQTARKTFARVAKDIDRAPCGLFNNAYPEIPRGSSTITQALYIESAALLAARTPDRKDDYLEKAKAAWREFKRLAYIDGLIQGDGIHGDGTTCQNNYAFLTYLEGASMAAMVALHQADGDDRWLNIGQSIAEKTISGKYGMVVNGIAKDFCDDEFSCNGDVSQFKGIMMRGFYAMHKARPSTANGQIPQFLKNNADSIWTKDRNTKTNLLGLNWNGPWRKGSDAAVNLATHSSATMALVYAAIVQ